MIKFFSAFKKPVTKLAAATTAGTSVQAGSVDIAHKLEKDVFTKGAEKLSVGDLARKFRESLITPFADWNDMLPEDMAAGNEVLTKILTKFGEPLEKMNAKQTEQFIHLVMGQSHGEVLSRAADNNKVVKEFIELIESKTGKTFAQILNVSD